MIPRLSRGRGYVQIRWGAATARAAWRRRRSCFSAVGRPSNGVEITAAVVLPDDVGGVDRDRAERLAEARLGVVQLLALRRDRDRSGCTTSLSANLLWFVASSEAKRREIDDMDMRALQHVRDRARLSGSTAPRRGSSPATSFEMPSARSSCETNSVIGGVLVVGFDLGDLAAEHVDVDVGRGEHDVLDLRATGRDRGSPSAAAPRPRRNCRANATSIETSVARSDPRRSPAAPPPARRASSSRFRDRRNTAERLPARRPSEQQRHDVGAGIVRDLREAVDRLLEAGVVAVHEDQHVAARRLREPPVERRARLLRGPCVLARNVTKSLRGIAGRRTPAIAPRRSCARIGRDRNGDVGEMRARSRVRRRTSRPAGRRPARAWSRPACRHMGSARGSRRHLDQIAVGTARAARQQKRNRQRRQPPARGPTSLRSTRLRDIPQCPARAGRDPRPAKGAFAPRDWR